MGFCVRPAEMGDLGKIVQLWQELSKGQLGKDPYYNGSLEFKGGYNQLKESIESEDCGIFVAENEGSVEGFIEVWTQVSAYQLEHDDCAYIVHCILNNQKKASVGIYRIIACLYWAAEKWAKEKGRKYLTADGFQHNRKVADFRGRAGVKPYKERMVRKI